MILLCLQVHFRGFHAGHELKRFVESVTFFYGGHPPPPCLLVIHRFQKLGRSEAGAIQQPRSLEQQDGQPSVGVTRRLHSSTLCLIGFLSAAPVTERRIHLSCRLQPANADDPGSLKPWRRLIYCWYDFGFWAAELDRQGRRQPHSP